MLKKESNPWAWLPSLYFIEGLPNAIIMTLTVILYSDLGIPNAEIALYTGLMYLPWVIKPFWSPFVDIIRTKRWWIIIMQLCMAGAFLAIGAVLNTPVHFAASVALFWIAAFCSATNDIATDGFYMLGLSEHQQSYFVGVRSLFYRISTWAVQFGIIYLAGYLQRVTGSPQQTWAIVFWALAAVFFAAMAYHTVVLPRSDKDTSASGQKRSAREILAEFGATFATFFQKPGIVTALAFMLLYRLPEAQLVKMINLFLLDPTSEGGLGLTKETVSVTYGVWGVGGLIIGGILGGIYAARLGLRRSLRPMAWAMSLSCATFVVLSQVEAPSRLLIDACVFVEQFGYGFGFSAYMLYLIYFSEGKYATAHYAISTAFMAIGLMVPGMFAGYVQEQLGYANFFIWTMVCCAATIAVANIVKVDPEFGLKKK